MTDFNKILKEAIPLSLYRDTLHKVKTQIKLSGKDVSILKDRYKDWFNGKWRITIPLDRSLVSELYNEVNEKLLEYDYMIVDWKGGLAKQISGNKQMRIGKLLQAKGEKELLQQFNERFSGKVPSKEDNYEIILSRHPYDIAGMSTDRDWSSCKELTTGSNKRYIPTEISEGCLIAYVINPKNEEDGIDLNNMRSITKFTDKFLKYFNGRIFKLNNYLWYKHEVPRAIFDRIITLDKIKAEYPIEYEKATNQKQDLLASPISRYMILPYVNEENHSDIYLNVADSSYGKHVESFKQSVQAWLDSKQGKKEGTYCLNTNKIFPDSSEYTITKADINKITNENFKSNHEQKKILDLYDNATSTDKNLLTKKFNQYLLTTDIKDICTYLFGAIPVLKITLKRLYEEYEKLLTKPIGIDNHIYFTYGELKFPNRTVKEISLFHYLFNLMERGKFIFEYEDWLKLMMLMKEAITEQQLSRKDIVFFEDMNKPIQIILDVFETNNNKIEGLVGNETITIDNVMVPANMYEWNETDNYFDADKICKEFELGGYNDWRLPTLNELSNIAIHHSKIRNLKAGWYWADDKEIRKALGKEFETSETGPGISNVISIKNGSSDIRNKQIHCLYIPVRNI